MGRYSLVHSAIAAVSVVFIGPLIGYLPAAGADPTIQAEPNYCTGTAMAPEAARVGGKDAVKASADFSCDQPQYVEWIPTFSGPGGTWTEDTSAPIPVPPQTSCTDQQPCGRLFTTNPHKIAGSLNGEVYTVTAIVKIRAPGTVLCGDPAHCYPFGTPLRTFSLPAVQAALYGQPRRHSFDQMPHLQIFDLPVAPRTTMSFCKASATWIFRVLVGLTALFVVAGAAACSSPTPPPAAPSTIVMPNLVGKYWAEAQPLLTSAGWTGMMDKGPDIPAVSPQDRNRVLHQNPTAGDQVSSDVRITLQFGS